MIVHYFFAYGIMHRAHVPMSAALGYHYIQFLANERLRDELDAKWLQIRNAANATR